MSLDYKSGLQFAVELGGGVWEGIQSHICPDLDEVRFRAPDGDILFLPARSCDAQLVRWKISEHKKMKSRKPVKATRKDLTELRNVAQTVVQKLDDLLEEKA